MLLIVPTRMLGLQGGELETVVRESTQLLPKQFGLLRHGRATARVARSGPCPDALPDRRGLGHPGESF